MTPTPSSRHVLTAALCSTLMLLGCGGAPDASTPDEGGGFITRTIVHANPDGSQSVTQSRVSLAQQAADVAARRARDASASAGGLATRTDALDLGPSACNGTAIWMFDNTNLTGNELCMDGLGAVILSNYCRAQVCSGGSPFPICHCVGYWNGAVRSFYAGQYKGYFYISSNYHTYFYAPLERDNTADAYTQAADQLHQYP